MQTHQEIGTKLNLFFIDEVSPGSIFWKPRGASLYNNLIRLIRSLYDEYNYVEVVTPNIADKKLWEISGHWDKYRENMFLLEKERSTCKDNNDNNDAINNDSKGDCKQNNVNIDNVDVPNNDCHTDCHDNNQKYFGLKAMNCPMHCLVFKNMKPYSKDLPRSEE